MKKLLLTSNGTSSEIVEKAFIELLGGSVADKKILVIRSSRKDPDEYAEYILEELKRVGFNEEKIRFVNPFREVASKGMKDYDAIYSAGGNTFTILDAMKKKGFDVLIKEMISEGKVYLGASAGTIILQKDIEIAGTEEGDENYIGLKDLTGFGVVGIEVYPHYEPINEKEVEEYEDAKGVKVERLKDGECIVVKDGVVDVRRM